MQNPALGAGAAAAGYTVFAVNPARRRASTIRPRSRTCSARSASPGRCQGLRDRSESARRPRRIVGRTPGRAALHAGRRGNPRTRIRSTASRPRSRPSCRARRGRPPEDDRGQRPAGPCRVVPRGAAGRQRADVEALYAQASPQTHVSAKMPPTLRCTAMPTTWCRTRSRPAMRRRCAPPAWRRS